MMRKRDIRARRRFDKGSGPRKGWCLGGECYEVPEQRLSYLHADPSDIEVPENLASETRETDKPNGLSGMGIGMVKTTRVSKA